jgi:hypothetical protein
LSDKEKIFRLFGLWSRVSRQGLANITPRYGARLYELRRAGRLRYRIEGDVYVRTWIEGQLLPAHPPVDRRSKPDLFPHGPEALMQALENLPESVWYAVLGRSYNTKGFFMKRLPALLERIERAQKKE